PRVRAPPRREVRNLGWDVRAGTPPHPASAGARSPRPRQRLTGQRVSRPPPRALADADLDRRGCVDTAPAQEVVVAPIDLATRQQADEFDARDVAAVLLREVADVQHRVLHAGPVDV